MKISEFNNLSFNKAADYYYHELGANPIPMDSQNKIPLVKWSLYQDQRIPVEIFEEWKTNGLFNKGIGLIAGKLYRSHGSEQYHFVAIDLDNQIALDKITTINDVKKSLEEFTKEGLVIEQHTGTIDRAHILFLSCKEYKKLSITATASTSKEVPAIEVRAAQDQLVCVTPSIHEDGTKRQIIGNPDQELEFCVSDNFDMYINRILKEFNISYLSESNDDGNGNDNKIPIAELFKDDIEIYEGHNRHLAILRVMDSLLKRNYGILDLDQIKKLSQEWNQKHCIPQLDNKEFEKQWKQATQFIGKQVEAETENKHNYNNKDTLDEKYPELQDNIYHKINDKPEKFIVADTRSNQLKEYESKYTTIKNGRDPEFIKYFLVDTNTYLGCIPIKIIKHKNPLTFLRIPELYSIFFVDISGERFTIKQKTLANIISSLKDRACVFKDGANNALNVITQAYKKRQLVEISEDIPYIGFLPIEGKDTKILVSNVEIKLPSSDEVARALSVIESLAEFYKNRLALLATSIVWSMIAPFNFIIKSDNYFLKILNLYGVANSTKTNTALIILAVDGHHEEKQENIYILSYCSVDSNAKFGEAFSKTTFQILVDEIEDLTDERKRSQFTENIKTLAGKKILRKRTSYNRNGEMDEFPALSPAILVSNYAPPLRDSGYMRRTITRNHPVEESIDPEDPRTKKFENFLVENLPKLKALGDFRNWYVTNHQEIIFNESRPKPLDIGLEILNLAYSYAGKQQEIPEWLVKERIPETQLVESIQENDVIIKSAFEKYINEQVIKAIPIWKQEDKDFELPKTTSERFLKLIRSELLPDVKFNKNHEILISKGILTELYRHGVNRDQLTDLRSLANYMCAGYRKNNNFFVVVTKTRLNEYFNTVIDDQMKIDKIYGSHGSHGSL